MMTPEETEKLILYRDANILVLNKPAGIPVHKGFGGGENLEMYFEHLQFGLPRAPNLAHRLDKDTSGCLVLGRHVQALKNLSRMFAEGQIKKAYWAVVKGKMPASDGRIDLALKKRIEAKHRWHMKTDSDGEAAVTDYKVLKVVDGYSWLELKPQTGRTHQLRVHCAAVGCPIVGDKIYGGEMIAPLQLHARGIEIPYNYKKPPIVVEAEAPGHFISPSSSAQLGILVS